MYRVLQKTAKDNEGLPTASYGDSRSWSGHRNRSDCCGGQRQHIWKGRKLAAWVGIVPGEYTTGGKQKLLGISKRGNKYLRTLFIQGARSVLQQRHKQAPGLSSWLAQLLARSISCWRATGGSLRLFVAARGGH